MNAQQYRQLMNRLQTIEEAGNNVDSDAVGLPPQAGQTALGLPPQAGPKDPPAPMAPAPDMPPQGLTGLLSKLQAMMSQLSPSEQDQLVKAFPQIQASAPDMPPGAMMQMPAKTGVTGLPSKQGDSQVKMPSAKPTQGGAYGQGASTAYGQAATLKPR